jgi:hypothetical protein
MHLLARMGTGLQNAGGCGANNVTVRVTAGEIGARPFSAIFTILSDPRLYDAAEKT